MLLTIQKYPVKGAKVNMQHSNGASALFVASLNGHTETVKFILDKGAKVNMQRSDGVSALIAASQNGHTQKQSNFF